MASSSLPLFWLREEPALSEAEGISLRNFS